MKTRLCFAIVVLAVSGVVAGEETVQLTTIDNGLKVQVNGEEFAVYRTRSDLPKPFFETVRGPGGTIMTRPIIWPGQKTTGGESAGLGHPHHKGIWLAVDNVNDVDFWAEKGKIETKSLQIVKATGNPAQFRIVNAWKHPDGHVVVTETSTISIFANRLIAYDITFSAGDTPVTFDDTKEGLFGFRMVTSMREKNGGHVVNADGLKGTRECWGKQTAWVDYYGEIEGKTFGVSLFDHPSNFRKSRYHVRDYGLFSISPFGERAYTSGKESAKPVVIPANGELRLRYGLYIHAGDTTAANVTGTYAAYVKSSD